MLEPDRPWALLHDILSTCAVLVTPVVTLVVLLRWVDWIARRTRAPSFVTWVGYVLVAWYMIALLAFPAAGLAEMGREGGGIFVDGVPLPTLALLASGGALLSTLLWLVVATLRWRPSSREHERMREP